MEAGVTVVIVSVCLSVTALVTTPLPGGPMVLAKELIQSAQAVFKIIIILESKDYSCLL